MSAKSFLATALALAGLGGSSYAAEAGPIWNHDPASQVGPFYWGSVAPSFATCGTTDSGEFVSVGQKQSPVDVDTRATQRSNLPALRFRYQYTPFEVENNGHVVEVPYEEGSRLRLSFFDPAATYEVLQFHFHAPSEHTVNGQHADMEMHIVHQNVLGDLAVVGVLMNRGPHPNQEVDLIMQNAPMTPGVHRVEHEAINVWDLLPRSRGYYSYSGSLTTPPCSEGVRWMVLQRPVTVSDFAVERMHQIVGQFPGYEGFADNNRPTLPLNGRTVLRRKRARSRR